LVTKNYRNFEKITENACKQHGLFVDLSWNMFNYGASFVNMIAKAKAEYYLES